jgi:hypothetical protein
VRHEAYATGTEKPVPVGPLSWSPRTLPVPQIRANSANTALPAGGSILLMRPSANGWSGCAPTPPAVHAGMGLRFDGAHHVPESANHLQAQGHPKREAIEEAAAIRLRPILMTTAAMVLGVIPLITASGAGAVSRFQTGVVIASGLSARCSWCRPCIWWWRESIMPRRRRAATSRTRTRRRRDHNRGAGWVIFDPSARFAVRPLFPES